MSAPQHWLRLSHTPQPSVDRSAGGFGLGGSRTTLLLACSFEPRRSGWEDAPGLNVCVSLDRAKRKAVRGIGAPLHGGARVSGGNRTVLQAEGLGSHSIATGGLCTLLHPAACGCAVLKGSGAA